MRKTDRIDPRLARRRHRSARTGANFERRGHGVVHQAAGQLRRVRHGPGATYEKFFANWGHTAWQPLHRPQSTPCPSTSHPVSLTETAWNATLLGPDPSSAIARLKDPARQGPHQVRHQPLRRHARARPPDRRVPLLDHARRGPAQGNGCSRTWTSPGSTSGSHDERRLENGSVILTYAPGGPQSVPTQAQRRAQAGRPACRKDVIATCRCPAVARLVGEFLDRLGLADVTLVGNDSGGAITQMLQGAPVERPRRHDTAGFRAAITGRRVLRCCLHERGPSPGSRRRRRVRRDQGRRVPWPARMSTSRSWTGPTIICSAAVVSGRHRDPADGLIAPALRSVVGKQANTRVVLADVRQTWTLDGRVVHALARTAGS